MFPHEGVGAVAGRGEIGRRRRVGHDRVGDVDRDRAVMMNVVALQPLDQLIRRFARHVAQDHVAGRHECGARMPDHVGDALGGFELREDIRDARAGHDQAQVNHRLTPWAT